MPIATFESVQQYIEQTLETAQDNATSAISQATLYANQLNLQAGTIVAPVINSPFQVPSLQPSLVRTSLPSVTLPTFTLPTAPTVTYYEDTSTLEDVGAAPIAPILDVATAPTLAIPTAPTAPLLDYDVVLPEVPVIDDVALPTLSVTVIGAAPTIISYADGLNDLERPVLDLIRPTAYAFVPARDGLRALKQAVEASLISRMQGGTGLSPAIEAAIWARESERERVATVAELDAAVRDAASSGFNLPPGALVAQLAELRQKHFERVVAQSRDIAVKQAELELTNLQAAITTAVEVDKNAYDEAFKYEQLAFEASKTYIDQQIEIYNGAVNEYRATVEAYRAYVEVYKTLIEAERSKVDLFKALLEAERVRAEVNTQRVEIYKAQLQAQQQRVEIYKAQLDGVRALVEVEKAQIEAFGEQVKAYSSLVGAETLRLEGYKAGVQADVARADIYKSTVDAFEARARTYSDRARLLMARAESQARMGELRISAYNSLVGAEGQRAQAQGLVTSAQLDLAKIATQSDIALNEAVSRANEVAVKHAEATSSLILAQGTTNAQLQMSARQLQQDSQKVASQVYAQVAASSIGVQHVSTAMSASANAALSNSTNISNGYNVNFRGAGTPNMREIY